MDGERRCGGTEFQRTGAAIEKLRRPSLVVLVHGTNRSPRTTERRPERPETSATAWTWTTSDTVKGCSNFELHPLRHRQPVQKVAKNWRGVLVFAKNDNETSSSVEYHLQSAGDSCRRTLQYSVAVVHSIDYKRSNECPPSVDGKDGAKRTERR